MKKWLIVLTGFILLLIAAIYIFIPAQVTISKTVAVKCPAAAAGRFLINDSNWLQWWPVNKHSPYPPVIGDHYFIYNKYTYRPERKMFSGVDMAISTDRFAAHGSIIIIPAGKDSVLLQGQSRFTTGNNPLTRITRYRKAATIKYNMEVILSALQTFLQKEKNLYGQTIEKTTVQDTLLIVTQQMFAVHPSIQDVYSLINKLKRYVQQQGAQETGYPMLNIRKINTAQFETMVAIPLNKEIKEGNNLLMKRMVPGHILVTEVKGGNGTVARAFAQLETYVNDHNMESPAKSFSSLVTNRLTEPDTTKWITRIYYPIF